MVCVFLLMSCKAKINQSICKLTCCLSVAGDGHQIACANWAEVPLLPRAALGRGASAMGPGRCRCSVLHMETGPLPFQIPTLSDRWFGICWMCFIRLSMSRRVCTYGMGKLCSQCFLSCPHRTFPNLEFWT